MARNDYPGVCFRCGLPVGAGQGHYRRDRGRWLVHHVNYKRQERDGGVTCMTARKLATKQIPSPGGGK